MSDPIPTIIGLDEVTPTLDGSARIGYDHGSGLTQGRMIHLMEFPIRFRVYSSDHDSGSGGNWRTSYSTIPGWGDASGSSGRGDWPDYGSRWAYPATRIKQGWTLISAEGTLRPYVSEVGPFEFAIQAVVNTEQAVLDGYTNSNSDSTLHPLAKFSSPTDDPPGVGNTGLRFFNFDNLNFTWDRIGSIELGARTLSTVAMSGTRYISVNCLLTFLI